MFRFKIDKLYIQNLINPKATLQQENKSYFHLTLLYQLMYISYEDNSVRAHTHYSH